MEYVSGNIFLRRHETFLNTGDATGGHAHAFDHTMIALSGSFRVSRLRVIERDMFNVPTDAEVIDSTDIKAGGERPWVLIEAGVYHSIQALEDGSTYVCAYSHRVPQALTMHEAGQLPLDDSVRVDPDGTQWVRVDPKVVQVSTGWEMAYK